MALRAMQVTLFLFTVLWSCGIINICVAQEEDAQNATSTCPVPSPPPDDPVDDPVCSLCPDGMVLDPEMADEAPQQEYSQQIVAALAQAGQSELIPVVLPFLSCGCSKVEYLFSSELLNSVIKDMDGMEEACNMFQMFLGSGDFPGGPEGCCTSTDDSSSGSGFSNLVGNNRLLYGGVLTLIDGFFGLLF